MEPQINMGNIIIIDENFVYTKDPIGGESIDLPEVRTQKIGYNSTAIRKKNIFVHTVFVPGGLGRRSLIYTLSFTRLTCNITRFPSQKT